MTSSGPFTIGSSGTLTANASTITVSGNWDDTAGTFTRGTSTVVFAASGTVATAGAAGVRHFYNWTTNVGVTTTFTTPQTIANVLTVNGTLVSSGGDAQRIFMVIGENSAGTPFVLGGSGNVSGSGYFVYRYEGGATFTVVGTVYQHVDIGGGASGFPETASLDADISTVACGVYVDCALLIASEGPAAAGTLTFNTNNHSVTSGGQFWLGDATTFGVTFNAGSSAISAFGCSPISDSTIVNMQTSTWTCRPSTANDPIAFESSYGSVINGGSATIAIHGQMRIGGTSSLSAESSTWQVLVDQGASNGRGEPGMVKIVSATAYVIFGSSTWTVQGLWQNQSTSASWDAGTGAVTFDFRGTSNTFRFGNFAQPEFFAATFNSGALTAKTVAFDGASGSLRASTLTISDSSSTTTLNPGNPSFNLQFKILDVASGGILLMDGFSAVKFTATTNAGLITLDVWQKFTTGNNADVRWHFNPDTPTTTISITQGGLGALLPYSLYRDGIDIQQAFSNGSGTVSFSVAGGWSPHNMVIAPPGGVPSGGAGGGGAGPGATPTWDWIATDDWTVTFVVTTPVPDANYQWILAGKVIGSGQQFTYTFERTGKYDVKMRATQTSDESVISETTKTVTVAGISFFAHNMPVLLLLTVGIWFIIMTAVLYDSPLGRILSFIIGVGFIIAGLWISAQTFALPSFGSLIAIELYASTALLMASAVAGSKSRGLALILFLIGLGLEIFALRMLF